MSERDEAEVVSLDQVGNRLRDKVKRKKQDARAEALAAQFHAAMGWKGKAGSTGGGKKKGKRKKR